MYLLVDQLENLKDHIRSEVVPEGEIGPGASGREAARVQEWMNLHGIGIAVDSDYGDITAGAVKMFQSRHGLPETGLVDALTFAHMTEPMRAVLRPPAAAVGGFQEAVRAIAAQHLAQHPREIGGENSGPWVRLYMDGRQGRDWPWCGGFSTFVMHQAAELTGTRMPIAGSFSCDTVAAQAREAGRFMAEGAVDAGRSAAGALFLVRRTATDWTHMGIVVSADGGAFRTVEGNTNDAGSREGFEVCARTRGYRSKDFVLI